MVEHYFQTLQSMLSEKRYQHSLGVSATALELAKLYGINLNKAALAGLLHDCAKEFSGEELLQMARENCIQVGIEEEMKPSLLHAPVGALVARVKFEVQDTEILRAIALHTLGDETMSVLDKIIFVSDKTESGRGFDPGEEWHQIARNNLDRAVLNCFDAAIIKSIHKGEIIHPQAVRSRNKLAIFSNQAGLGSTHF